VAPSTPHHAGPTRRVQGVERDVDTPQASTVSLPYHQQDQAYNGGSSTTGAGFSGRGAHADDTAARMDEIRRREMELAERERKLGQREEHVRNFGKNNWPPKPYWPFRPLLFHDIDEEIPATSRQIVSTLYRLWLLLVLTITLNLVACILLLVTGAEDGGKDLGGSIVDLFIIPLAFLLWYRYVEAWRHVCQYVCLSISNTPFPFRPVYNAYMKEQAFYYYLYFVFNAFHIAFCVYSLIGIPSTGSAGIINTISSFGRGSILSGVFCILSTVAWGIESVSHYQQIL
jgi:hypothetical protein